MVWVVAFWVEVVNIMLCVGILNSLGPYSTTDAQRNRNADSVPHSLGPMVELRI